MKIINKQPELFEEDAWAWYLNIPLELQDYFLTDEEKSHFAEYYHEAGLLRPWRRSFFRHHYSRTLAQAANFLFAEKQSPLILDLGCGTGTQSLCFALMGARVVAVDMDSLSLSVFKKRIHYYEQISGRSLDITIHEANIFSFDFSSIGTLDGIHSLFAFNMMLPTIKLLDLLADNSRVGCRFAVLDGNNQSWLSKVIPSRRRDQCLSPVQLASELEKRGFRVTSQMAGFSIPPVFWYVLPNRMLHYLDTYLGKNSQLAISHQTLACNGKQPSHLSLENNKCRRREA